MVLTDEAKSKMALLLYGSGVIPQYCGIGIGSGEVATSNIALITKTGTRALYSTGDTSTPKEITWTFDFNSVNMSGVNLTEYGIFEQVATGSTWSREGFDGIQFDGANELQIQTSYTIF